MIDYELALRLKNAGFPQGGDGLFVTEPPNTTVAFQQKDGEVAVFPATDNNANTAYCPTLSELIAACGDRFDGLQINHGERSDRKWQAYGIGGANAYGSTPEEAVANLWLKLRE